MRYETLSNTNQITPGEFWAYVFLSICFLIFLIYLFFRFQGWLYRKYEVRMYRGIWNYLLVVLAPILAIILYVFAHNTYNDKFWHVVILSPTLFILLYLDFTRTLRDFPPTVFGVFLGTTQIVLKHPIAILTLIIFLISLYTLFSPRHRERIDDNGVRTIEDTMGDKVLAFIGIATLIKALYVLGVRLNVEGRLKENMKAYRNEPHPYTLQLPGKK